MKVEEFIEREFSINENGIILDDVGNEYRNENGEIERLEDCPHEGDITYLDLTQIDGCPQYIVRCRDCGKLGVIYLEEGDNDFNCFTKPYGKYNPDEE